MASRFVVSEFSGNSITIIGTSEQDAVTKYFGRGTKVYPDGYVMKNGEHLGWVTVKD